MGRVGGFRGLVAEIQASNYGAMHQVSPQLLGANSRGRTLRAARPALVPMPFEGSLFFFAQLSV